MIVSADWRISMFERMNFIAIVVVSVASRFALIPLPSPSERTAMLRFSFSSLCHWKLSPQAA